MAPELSLFFGDRAEFQQAAGELSPVVAAGQRAADQADLETLLQVLEQEPAPPRQLNPGLPLDLDTIVLKCLEKSPERRYATAQDLADEFKRFLAGRPIHARRIGRIERGWRWCKRNPVVAALSSAAALLLVAALSIFVTAYFREVDLRRTVSNRLVGETQAKIDAVAAGKRETNERVHASTSQTGMESACTKIFPSARIFSPSSFAFAHTTSPKRKTESASFWAAKRELYSSRKCR